MGRGFKKGGPPKDVLAASIDGSLRRLLADRKQQWVDSVHGQASHDFIVTYPRDDEYECARVSTMVAATTKEICRQLGIPTHSRVNIMLKLDLVAALLSEPTRSKNDIGILQVALT